MKNTIPLLKDFAPFSTLQIRALMAMDEVIKDIKTRPLTEQPKAVQNGKPLQGRQVSVDEFRSIINLYQMLGYNLKPEERKKRFIGCFAITLSSLPYALSNNSSTTLFLFAVVLVAMATLMILYVINFNSLVADVQIFGVGDTPTLAKTEQIAIREQDFQDFCKVVKDNLKIAKESLEKKQSF